MNPIVEFEMSDDQVKRGDNDKKVTYEKLNFEK